MLYDNENSSADHLIFLKDSQQNTGSVNLQIQSESKKSGHTNSKEKKLANKLTNPAKHKVVSPDFCGREVDASLSNMKSKAAQCSTQEELRFLSNQLLTILECERQRIAADLHDGLGQSLSLMMMYLETSALQINSGEFQQAQELLQKLKQKVKETMAELHRTTMDMRPSMLDDLGIIPTLTWFFREFESAWQGRKIEKNFSVVESDVPILLKTTIFRILQEAMNNIVKHACADLIKISLYKSGGFLQLSIEDNGHGFDLERVTMRCSSGNCGFACGFGLLTMKERARSTNGIFEMQSDFEQGTKILISWPSIENTVN